MNAPIRQPAILTDDQYEDMARKGAFTKVGRVELRGGVIVAMSPVHLKHSSALFALAKAIEAALIKAGLPLEVAPEVTVKFGQGFSPTADVAVFDPVATPANFDGPLPASAVKLVVEIADSSLADDLGDKAREYAAARLPEYWVADVKSRTLFLHAQPSEAGYGVRRTAAFGDRVEALTLPITTDTAGA
jgi:Uma2 family endonuclease